MKMKGKHPVSHWIDMGQETLLVVPHTEADVGSPLMQHLPIYSPSTPAPSLCCQGKRIYVRFAELAEFHQELLFTFVSEANRPAMRLTHVPVRNLDHLHRLADQARVWSVPFMLNLRKVGDPLPKVRTVPSPKRSVWSLKRFKTVLSHCTLPGLQIINQQIKHMYHE